MKNCVIVGAGAYGRVYAQYLSEEYKILGFFDNHPNLKGKEVNGIPILGNIDLIHDFIKDIKDTAIFVPLGDNKIRVSLLKQFMDLGYNLPSYIHKNSHIHESVKIGRAVYVLCGVNIMPFTVIGDFVMISVGVSIAHHTQINEGCFFSMGTTIGASVIIQPRAYFGVSTVLMTGVQKIGENTMIGAGSVIIKNVPDNAVMVGNPARYLKENC